METIPSLKSLRRAHTAHTAVEDEAYVKVPKKDFEKLTVAASSAAREGRQLKQRLKMTAGMLSSVIGELGSSKRERDDLLRDRIEKLLQTVESNFGSSKTEDLRGGGANEDPELSSPTFALDAIARLDQMQHSLLARGSGAGSPTKSSNEVIQQLQQQLEAANQTIKSLQDSNSQLQKDVQLSLLSITKSTQSRALAAAFAARHTKIYLEEQLSAIAMSPPEIAVPPIHTPSGFKSPVISALSTPRATQNLEEIDIIVKKLTSRLDALQQELDSSLDTCSAYKRKIHELESKAQATASDVDTYQSRITILEAANVELKKTTNSHNRSIANDRDQLVRQVALLEDLSEKSSRRVAALESRLRSEEDKRLALRSKCRVAIESISSSKNSKQWERGIQILVELFEMAPVTLGATHINKENIEDTQLTTTRITESSSNSTFSKLRLSKESPQLSQSPATAVAAVSPMDRIERGRRLTPAPLR